MHGNNFCFSRLVSRLLFSAHLLLTLLRPLLKPKQALNFLAELLIILFEKETRITKTGYGSPCADKTGNNNLSKLTENDSCFFFGLIRPQTMAKHNARFFHTKI